MKTHRSQQESETDAVPRLNGCDIPETNHDPGATVTELSGTEHREFHVTVRPRPSETQMATLARLGNVLREKRAVIVRQEIFGALNEEPETRRALQESIGPVCWPILWVEGAGAGGSPLAGIHTMAVADAAVESIEVKGRVVGRTFSDGDARHVLLGDLRSDDITQPRPVQAERVFENLEGALHQSGMTFANLARTWLFLDDILAWYGPFNKVRTEFFQQRRVLDHLVPASTGIGARNPAGAALVAGAWAAKALNNTFTVREIPSPLQGTSRSYGSAFARAVELVSGGLRRLLISGTASITKDGHSAHPGDIRGQVDLTLNVVRAILASRGMDFADATRVTAYVKHPHDAPVFDAWLAEQELRSWPVITTPATICRDDLLFEVELDAVSTTR